MTVTEFGQQTPTTASSYCFVNIGLMVEDRAKLATKIEQRFQCMLQQGFIEEVIALRQRLDLHANMPSMRAVGYRQIWDYLEGNTTQHDMQELAITATRQLAKRQLTWMRSWPEITFFSVESPHLHREVQQFIYAYAVARN